MAFTHHIEPEQKLISIDYSGGLTLDCVFDAYDEVFSSPDFNPAFDTLSSLIDVTSLDFDFRDIGKFRHVVKTSDTRTGRVALVMGQRRSRYLFGKMAAMQYSMVRQNPYKAFSTITEALAWFKQD